MEANIKFKPFIHSVKYSENNKGEIICSLGDWCLVIPYPTNIKEKISI